MDPQDHRHQVEGSLVCAVITVSDTRTPETDRSGAIIREALCAGGHCVPRYVILPDEPHRIRDELVRLCSDGRYHAVLVNGGTGIAPRDTTYEAVVGLLEKRLDGFGELFRMLSYHEIGAAAMLSRAVAGIRSRTAVFSMPGSPAAVQLAMDKLIMPQLGHVARLLTAAGADPDHRPVP